MRPRPPCALPADRLRSKNGVAERMWALTKAEAARLIRPSSEHSAPSTHESVVEALEEEVVKVLVLLKVQRELRGEGCRMLEDDFSEDDLPSN